MSKKDRYKKKMKAQAAAQAATSTIHSRSQSSVLNDSYVITSEPITHPWTIGLPAEADRAVQRLHALSQTSPFRAIPELLEWIERYPEVPPFYNYLANAYGSTGDFDNAAEILIKTYQLFPDYLFGELNYIQFLTRTGDLEQASEILNGRFTLGERYPDRRVFHLSEALSFNCIIGLYLVCVGRTTQARELYQEMLSFAPHDRLTAILRDKLDQCSSFDDEDDTPTAKTHVNRVNSPARASFAKELLAKLLGKL